MAPTFASAAAQNQNSSRESAEWSRRPNGATQTFRRPSGPTSTTSFTPPQETSAAAQPARYVPPHRNGAQADTRYSREQLLDLFRAQRSVLGSLQDGIEDLFIGGWQPDAANGPGSASWGRNEASRDAQPAPDICWDADGATEPMGLVEMDDAERQTFAFVNTPIKTITATKENQQTNGLPGRKISISSQATTPGGYGPLSPTTTRGPGRRRETSESFSYPSNSVSSPTTGGFGRDEPRAASPPPALTRRRTDLKDANKVSEREIDGEEKFSSNPLGTLKRNPTGPLNAGFGSASSPWATAPTSAGLSPMGSFGNFGLSQQGSSTEKRPSLSSGRAESRFKTLLSKDGDDSAPRTVERKTSLSGLPRVQENESWRPLQSEDLGGSALDESEEDFLSGSAALGADLDPQLVQGSLQGFGTPHHPPPRDDYGFGAFGMTSDNTQGFGQGFFQQSPAAQRQMGVNEPMSPTSTNPYQSPEQHSVDHLTEDLGPDISDINSAQLSGLGGFGQEQPQHLGGLGGLGALPNLGRAVAPASDRSQTSSAGASRGFPSLGGIGQLGGASASSMWPVSHGGIGTPTRQTSGLSSTFGSGIFQTVVGDVQSPGLAGLGNGSMMSPQGGIGGSRLASMFPSAMQEEMRYTEHDQFDKSFDVSGQYGRDIEGSERLGLVQNETGDRSLDSGPPYGIPVQQTPIGQPVQQSQEQQRAQQSSIQSQSQQSSSAASNQPPPPQQRTMVMPDRMRWIYRDPQGQTQGPWSGLEMHDWYKAGFFSPELLVKKYEDPEYEPLAQLIRRIGNSREPFLVPQIGIPHGAPGTSGPPAWAGSTGTTSTSAAGGAQPPFASSFPSFGTTLTAEQQNALERRKQEEQYLMARQKEHLAQAQIAQRIQHQQVHHGTPSQHTANLMPGSGQLHHHGSAQSLHSQPSFGSMASPSSGAYQQSPNQGPQGQPAGFFDGSIRAPGQSTALSSVSSGADNLAQMREDEIPGIMDRLNLGSRAMQGQYGAPGQPLGGQQQQAGPDQHERQVQQMMEDRARLRQEQDQYDAAQSLQGNEQAAANERFQQFQQFQGGAMAGIDARFQPAMSKTAEEIGSSGQSSIGSPISAQQDLQQPQELSLTEQVKAASVQQSPVQQQSGLPKPFPPAPSQSPLPAPAAQRTGRQSVADQLQTDQHELVETPSADTPSALAPWAKETNESSKGPSLKDIQAMEAKKAAEAEEMASAARRAAFQREMEAAQSQAPPAPGLPASASWAGGSPATPTGNGASPWAKAAQKPTASSAAKSMAQIQKEEEARKKKVAAAAASIQPAAVTGVASPAGGKSYANLAGKVASPVNANSVGGVWTTVGAGGKSKTPAAPPAAAPTRAVSSGVVPTTQSAAAVVKKPLTRSSTMASPGAINAQEEFRKWAVGELRPDLNKGIAAEEFVNNLIVLPQDSDMLTEAVHGASSTIDSRHFAEEFIRRKKLADKGLVDTSAPPKSVSPHSASVDKSGGWSEVAKKGPTKELTREESNGNFRVVASKKKGSKR